MSLLLILLISVSHTFQTPAIDPVALSKFRAGNFLVIIIFHLPPFFRPLTRPTARRAVGRVIHQNVRLDRDRCAITFLTEIRIFRDASREKLRKISHWK